MCGFTQESVNTKVYVIAQKNMLTIPKYSSICEHSHSCATPFSIDDFTILANEHFPFALRILESLYVCTYISIGLKSMAHLHFIPCIFSERLDMLKSWQLCSAGACSVLACVIYVNELLFYFVSEYCSL